MCPTKKTTLFERAALIRKAANGELEDYYMLSLRSYLPLILLLSIPGQLMFDLHIIKI